jgi:hypothetical protein
LPWAPAGERGNPRPHKVFWKKIKNEKKKEEIYQILMLKTKFSFFLI